MVRDPGRSQVVRPDLRVRGAGPHSDGHRSAVPDRGQGKKEDLAETRSLLEAEAPQDAAADPAKAELAAQAKEEQAAAETKQARKQRKRMNKIRAKLAEAERS